MAASKTYLDPEIVARLRGLELRVRSVTAGSVSGMHRSAYHGFSVEFAEHRQYVPGDDIRYMDWRIFGRADRLYIKQYEEETNLYCNLLVDASRSMAYPTAGASLSRTGSASPGRSVRPPRRTSMPEGRSKYDYAAALAASLAYVLIGQQDSAGLVTFDSEVRQSLPPGSGKTQLANFVSILEQTEPEHRTDVKILFHRLAEELRRRSMVVLISDLLADADDVVSGIEHICYAGHELIVLHVMHDHEWNFPMVENALFEGLEEEVHLLADPQSLRRSYLDAVQRFVTRVEGVCLKHRADYVPINTRDPLDGVLCGYLARRAGRTGGARRR
ncbi:MAG: DUF58 domain-containing protein [Planctomycetes bacterium]|nr:DUF58 domain-containing protein [Planctomycetota bacterium]